MSHVALLGDSVFDNRSYTGGEPDVVTHLRALLPAPWQATLYAVDGTTTIDLGRQLDSLRDHVSHVVLSVGGNDALLNADLLDLPVRSTAQALELFQVRLSDFAANYRNALEAVSSLGRPTTICTIYNGNLAPPEGARARVALALFNDVILRGALELGSNLIDLRLVCTEPSDFANPIEPSGSGGRKIARAIAHALKLGEGTHSIGVTAG
ncbi:MAG: SGNH/GDSL hydrolase family protein [Polyangiaceae bacterium]